ncbi:hypothetical protein [Thalassotalea atypica]|uniref:hypothetical protein n=1 Tax=Thalassotalea atypica TaxID=2054316 RepID=UPI002572C9E3|nr:hypothetical protein [Thalassotalea atypica]
MSKLTQELTQYKHYLILLCALIVANYIVVPLSDWQTEQQQTYTLLDKKSDKISSLLNNQQEFGNQLALVNEEVKQIASFNYTQQDEAKFKLTAQSNIEKILSESGCSVDRIGFKGNTIVDERLSKWRIELRFKGDAVCLTKTTRAIETAKPLFNIEDFNFNHRNFDIDAKGSFNAVMNINAWHLKGGV